MSDKKFVIESNFEHKGFRCGVVFNGCTGSRCGYVEIPADHPIAGKGWGELSEIDMHGGCTFVSNGPSDYPVESELGWIGFDCAHYGDAQDHEAWNEYFPDTFQKWQSLQLLHYCPGSEVRSKGYCEEQCRQIVHQLIEMQKGSTRE